jgi:rhamnulokinase
MTTSHTYLACDLGAESGRVMRGVLCDGRLEMTEIHRFPTGGIAFGHTLRWDLPRILDELRTGLRKATALGRVDALSTDSWGVDYVLCSANEPVLSLPYHYRDRRGDDAFKRTWLIVPRTELYRRTGIQSWFFNSVYQWHHDAVYRRPLLDLADRALLMADWFNWAFSGVGVAEETLASTTQLYDPHQRAWARDLADRLGFPARLLPPVVAPGTVLGPALPDLNLGAAQVVAGCSHDTAAAVAAVPAEDDGWAYLSSGTWSLIGIEAPAPIVTDAAHAFGASNELGVNGTVRFLKNIVGLWIVQECRRHWQAQGQELGYDELTRLASESEPLRSLIDPDDPRFAAPGDMPGRISAACRESGQPVPETPGQFVRCALESLALAYRRSLDALEGITQQRLTRLHIVGGGTKNRLLSQMAADATGRQVIAGPVEATAAGNLLVQALALGHLKDLAELRAVVRRSFPVETFKPAGHAAWDAAYKRFGALR